MKIRYLIILATILFVIGCVPPEATPTETPEETVPEETVPTETTEEETIPEKTTETITSDIVIKERTVTPTELTIPVGTEVSISVEGERAHTIIIDKEANTIDNIGVLTDGKSVSYTFDEAGSYIIKSLKVGTIKVAVTVE